MLWCFCVLCMDGYFTANSVGFKQIKKCINTYKMHPAVRLESVFITDAAAAAVCVLYRAASPQNFKRTAHFSRARMRPCPINVLPFPVLPLLSPSAHPLSPLRLPHTLFPRSSLPRWLVLSAGPTSILERVCKRKSVQVVSRIWYLSSLWY
jgi:hypothetical protein